MVEFDKRRRQYFPLSVYWASGATAKNLKTRFGRDGILVWVCYLTACKTNWIQGQMTYTSEPDGWSKLTLYGYEPDFSLAEFFAYTGRLHLTRIRRSGDVVDVLCRGWDEWNKEFKRERDAKEKSSKRAENTSDNATTLGATEVDVEVEFDEEVDARALAPETGARLRLVNGVCSECFVGSGLHTADCSMKGRLTA